MQIGGHVKGGGMRGVVDKPYGDAHERKIQDGKQVSDFGIH
jgi:hypothetical protein